MPKTVQPRKSTAASLQVPRRREWTQFDRKYVIRPSLDYGLAYPVALTDPNWTTQW